MRIHSRPKANDTVDDVIVDGRVITGTDVFWVDAYGGPFNPRSAGNYWPDPEDEPYYGTDFNDVIFDTGTFREYYAGGGDDVIWANPIGLVPSGTDVIYYPDDYFYGEGGSDTVTYALSENEIVASLWYHTVRRFHDGLMTDYDYLESIENLIGSSYNDVIEGHDGANQLRGFGGNDTIDGRDGNDQIWGDSGNDTLNGGDGNDTVAGGTGNDTMDGGADHDTLTGGDGADIMTGGAGHDTVDGGSGNDTIDGGSGRDTLIGGDGVDTMTGGADDDVLNGGDGDDTIHGGSGIDTVVYTGSGAVNVYLSPGYASGAWGSDTLIDIERVETGSGNDVVHGTAGGNRFEVGGGNDTVLAFGGNDVVYAGSGDDVVYGHAGTDFIYGWSGNDTLWGGSDGDVIHGEDGNDRLLGENGNDQLYGEAGADRIRGGDGIDTINGGSGADVIEWHAGDEGMDHIMGFNLAEDRLWFNAGFFQSEPGAVGLSNVLGAFDYGDHTWLTALTADGALTAIATLYDVDHVAVAQMIANGSILGPAPQINFGGMPGDFELQ